MTGDDQVTIACATLYDGVGRAGVSDAVITVQGGRIVNVGPRTAVGVDIDYSEHTIVPGLIDAHAHPCFGVAGSAEWARVADDPLGRFAWGISSAQAALAAGVTTLIDVGSAEGVAISVAAAERRGHFAGPRILASGGAVTVTGGHGVEIGTIADTGPELVTRVRQAVEAGADLIKIMATGGAIDPRSNRRRAQYSTAQLHAAVVDAHRLKRRVVAHANATEGVSRAVDAGVDVIAHCNWLGLRGGTVEIDWDTVDKMAQQQTWIDLNVQGALRNLAHADGEVTNWPAGRAEPTTRWELLGPLRERGIGTYLSSDGFGPAVATFPQSLRDFCSMFAVPVEQMLGMVTSAPASALGLDDIGTLVPGAVADFVVLPGDLAENVDALTRPTAVYRDGLEVARNGWLRLPHAGTGGTHEHDAQNAFLAAVLGSSHST